MATELDITTTDSTLLYWNGTFSTTDYDESEDTGGLLFLSFLFGTVGATALGFIMFLLIRIHVLWNLRKEGQHTKAMVYDKEVVKTYKPSKKTYKFTYTIWFKCVIKNIHEQDRFRCNFYEVNKEEFNETLVGHTLDIIYSPRTLLMERSFKVQLGSVYGLVLGVVFMLVVGIACPAWVSTFELDVTAIATAVFIPYLFVPLCCFFVYRFYREDDEELIGSEPRQGELKGCQTIGVRAMVQDIRHCAEDEQYSKYKAMKDEIGTIEKLLGTRHETYLCEQFAILTEQSKLDYSKEKDEQLAAYWQIIMDLNPQIQDLEVDEEDVEEKKEEQRDTNNNTNSNTHELAVEMEDNDNAPDIVVDEAEHTPILDQQRGSTAV